MAEQFCRWCGQPIAWSTLIPSGKRVPLDTSPDPDCGCYLRDFHVDGDGRRASTVTQLSGPDLEEARVRARHYPADRATRLWVPHFASCTGRRPGPASIPAGEPR